MDHLPTLITDIWQAGTAAAQVPDPGQGHLMPFLYSLCPWLAAAGDSQDIIKSCLLITSTTNGDPERRASKFILLKLHT